MAFEDLKIAISMILDEIEKAPQDAHILQEQLREKLSELKSLGLPVPENLQRFEDELEDEDAFFDNMPV